VRDTTLDKRDFAGKDSGVGETADVHSRETAGRIRAAAGISAVASGMLMAIAIYA
jgi:hypothetical protein